MKILLGGGHVLIAATAKTCMDSWLGTLTCKMTSVLYKTNRRGWPTSNMHPRHTSHMHRHTNIVDTTHACVDVFVCMQGDTKAWLLVGGTRRDSSVKRNLDKHVANLGQG